MYGSNILCKCVVVISGQGIRPCNNTTHPRLRLLQLYRARFSSNARVTSAIMDYGYLYLLTVETSEYLIMENMEDLFAFCENRTGLYSN